MAAAGLKSCPVTGFRITYVEASECATTVLIGYLFV
jgi:hypothetical protein